MSSFAATQFLPAVATGSAAKNFFVVSIHDVAPSTQEIAKKIIADLAYRPVRVCSLLVVPDYHHEGSFTKDRQFISWLRDLESDGHEIVIHGYFHERPRRNQETLRDKFITEFYTQQEGEFYDLDYDEALRRIMKARNEFHGVGLSPRGFVAPAWLLNAESERAARDADMEYTTRLRTLHDLRSGEIFSARSLVYSVRNRWRRGTSLMWNAALAQWLKTNQLLRLSIHPPDYLYPRIWRQIGDLISGMDAQRTLTTYKDWITEQRTRASNES
ncbi:MAG: polysaccharide deacetylase family protein [Verrucomicrobiota bacterium]|nr:polysaccharide deacetylase family protein [Verrucomicrobiota bacterium]